VARTMHGFRPILYEIDDINRNSGSAVARTIVSAFQRCAGRPLSTTFVGAGISHDRAQFWVGLPIQSTLKYSAVHAVAHLDIRPASIRIVIYDRMLRYKFDSEGHKFTC
jgi:hypothetical protein